MDQHWVDQKYQEYLTSIEERRQHLRQAIEGQNLLDEQSRNKYLEIIGKNNWTYDDSFELEMMCVCGVSDEVLEDKDKMAVLRSWKKTITDDIHHIYEYYSYYRHYGLNPYDRFLNSTPKYFEGDVIITDPCYVMRKEDTSDRPLHHISDYFPYGKLEEYPDYNPETKESAMFAANRDRFNAEDDAWVKAHPDDWDKCDMGDNMEALGFQTYMTRDTLYGDWSCTTFNSDTEEPIGKFCADAGLVSVFLLKEILRYNPEYKVDEETTYAATLIRNFKGHIQFIVTEETGTYEEDSPYHKAGDSWVEHSVQVVGHGVNSETNEPINFITAQTGF